MFSAQRIKRELTELTCALVNIPTENKPPLGFERQGQEYLKTVMYDMGLEITDVSPLEIPDFAQNTAFLNDRDYTGRYNVIGRWKGSGGGSAKSLLLSGHMDVAPKEPMPWTVCDPFESTVLEGRIYGRGTADMKGGLACAVVAVKLLKESGFIPRGDIILESVIDEEYAGVTGTIVSRLLGYNADFGILLEPTGLMICPACVGGLVIKLTVNGTAGMPFTGEEITNPAHDIARVIESISRFASIREKQLNVPTLWEKTLQKPQIIITKVKAGEVQPHGQLSLPIDAWTELVIQTYPGEKHYDVIEEFSNIISEDARLSKKDFTVEMLYRYCKPAALSIDTPAVELLKLSTECYTKKTEICGAMFSCDLFAFEEFGNMPAVIFGPTGGRLHAPDEWVDIESQYVVVQTLMDFIRKWCY